MSMPLRYFLLFVLLFKAYIYSAPYQSSITEISDDFTCIQLDNGLSWRIDKGILGFFDQREKVKSWRVGDEVALNCFEDFRQYSSRPYIGFDLKNLRLDDDLFYINCIIEPKNWFSPYQIQEIQCQQGYFSQCPSVQLTDGSLWSTLWGHSVCGWEIGDRIIIHPHLVETKQYVLFNFDYYLRKEKNIWTRPTSFFYAWIQAQLDD